MDNHWGVSHVTMIFALIALIIGVVLMLSIITRKNDEVDCDKANIVRANLLLLTALVLAVFVLVAQRFELSKMVKHLVA